MFYDQNSNLNTVRSGSPRTMLYSIGKFLLFLIIIAVVLLVAVIHFLISAPRGTAYPLSFDIKQGDSLQAIATRAESVGLVKSKLAFQTAMFLMGGDRKILAGTYAFESRANVLGVASRIALGKRDINSLKVTIPEGYSRIEMAQTLESKIPEFSADLFLSETKGMEGYLFPETYYFLPGTTAQDAIAALKEQYEKKIAPLRDDIVSSGKTEEEIIIMASIIEKEATGESDRALISGVLWKRLSLGMPLQVDATFLYINGKSSSELTLDDLNLNSPYNTYINKGLPPGPICSPGIESIKAALNPEESSYLYYLHDKNGGVHFAKTFEEHKQNKQKYLK